MLSIMARDSRSYPSSLIIFPPSWNPFSTATETPSTLAPLCSAIDINPLSALPSAKKSSIKSNLSPSFKTF